MVRNTLIIVVRANNHAWTYINRVPPCGNIVGGVLLANVLYGYWD